MKTPLSILVVGRHPEIMATVLRLLRSRDGVTADGRTTDEGTLALMGSGPWDLLLIGGGVEAESREALSARFSQKYPNGKTLVHFGGGGGLLWNEIEEALSRP